MKLTVRIKTGLYNKHYMVSSVTQVTIVDKKPTKVDLRAMADVVAADAFYRDDLDPNYNGINKQHAVVDMEVIKLAGSKKPNSIMKERFMFNLSDFNLFEVEDLPAGVRPFKATIIYPFATPNILRHASHEDSRFPKGRPINKKLEPMKGELEGNCGIRACQTKEDVTYYNTMSGQYLCYHCATEVPNLYTLKGAIREFNDYEFENANSLLKFAGFPSVEAKRTTIPAKYETGSPVDAETEL